MMTSKIMVAVIIQIFYATIDILTNDLHIHSLPLFVEILCEISNKPTTLSFLGLKLHILKNLYLTNNMTLFLIIYFAPLKPGLTWRSDVPKLTADQALSSGRPEPESGGGILGRGSGSDMQPLSAVSMMIMQLLASLALRPYHPPSSTLHSCKTLYCFVALHWRLVSTKLESDWTANVIRWQVDNFHSKCHFYM